MESCKTENIKLGVIIPSRGLVMARTMIAVIAELREMNIKWDLRMPDTLSIPDCFNLPISSLLFEECTHILIVEEDVLLPYGAIKAMFDLNADVAVIDYPLRNGWSPIVKHKNGDVLWSGTGCILIKNEVLKRHEMPYFRCDTSYVEKENGVFEEHREQGVDYGGHDIEFGMRCRKLGFQIKQVEGMQATHLELIELGSKLTNNGLHKIKEHKEIKKRRVLNKFKLIC